MPREARGHSCAWEGKCHLDQALLPVLHGLPQSHNAAFQLHIRQGLCPGRVQRFAALQPLARPGSPACRSTTAPLPLLPGLQAIRWGAPVSSRLVDRAREWGHEVECLGDTSAGWGQDPSGPRREGGSQNTVHPRALQGTPGALVGGRVESRGPWGLSKWQAGLPLPIPQGGSFSHLLRPL